MYWGLGRPIPSHPIPTQSVALGWVVAPRWGGGVCNFMVPTGHGHISPEQRSGLGLGWDVAPRWGGGGVILWP